MLARKDELEDALADISPWDVVERQALEAALMTINALVIGDLVHPSDVVAHVLSRWLERNKYLGAEITHRHRLERARRSS